MPAPTTRIPLVATPDNRSSSTLKDAKLVNAYVEKTEGDSYVIIKRPGLVPSATLSLTDLPNPSPQLYNWKDVLYRVTGGKITTVHSSTGFAGTALPVAPFWFNQTLGIPNYMFLMTPSANPTDLGSAYVFDGTTVTAVTDPDYPPVLPVTRVAGSCFIDNTLYVMDSDGTIHGSQINDPTSWDPLNTIRADSEGDQAVFLARQLVYAVAFKEWSIQFFYDAANAVGSPLLPVPAANLPYGCANAFTVRSIDGILYWLSRTRSGSIQARNCNNLKSEVISTPSIDRILASVDYSLTASWDFNLNSHSFYGLTFPNSNITLVYDITTKLWSQWTDTDGNFWQVIDAGTEGLTTYVSRALGGQIMTIDPYTYTDLYQRVDLPTTTIPVEVVTPNFDGGSRFTKHMAYMEVVADQTPGSVLSVRVSDDDYQTWTNFRQIPLDRMRPIIYDCGSFRRRAFHFKHSSPTSLRLQAVETLITPGTL